MYKRPGSNVWQYFLSIEGEGIERKSTGVQGDIDDPDVGLDAAKAVALDRKLEVMSRQKQGLKARRVKGMFDFIDEFLEEESKRVRGHNIKGNITKETFRQKRHHLSNLKIFYLHAGKRNPRLEDLDYSKLHKYPLWRQTTTDENLGIKPPKTSHSILTELSTIRAYFAYLEREGYISRFPTFHKLIRESKRDHRRDYLNPKEYKQTINTVRAWSNSTDLTPTQQYNRKVIYQVILIMSNSCLRKGELKGLLWSDLVPNDNLTQDEQKVGHLIKVRPEISKVGVSRTVQSPTVERFNDLRKLAGIPKQPKSDFPHIPPEYRHLPILSKFNHQDTPLGVGTWDRTWQAIKKVCADRYWNRKNITWYSFRHTGISFAVSRSVPMLQLARNCGTGIRYIEDVYYHHEAESKQTWDILTQNRDFTKKISRYQDEPLMALENVLEAVEL